jgi:hypothetical protein
MAMLNNQRVLAILKWKTLGPRLPEFHDTNNTDNIFISPYIPSRHPRGTFQLSRFMPSSQRGNSQVV